MSYMKASLINEIDFEKMAVTLLKGEFEVIEATWENSMAGYWTIEAKLLMADGSILSVKKEGGTRQWNL